MAENEENPSETEGFVPNVGLNSNTRRGSECMETEFMGHHSNQRRSSVQNVGFYSNTRRGSGCMQRRKLKVLEVENAGKLYLN